MHQVLLYYKYVTISDPATEMKKQRMLCEKLNLTGRIIVANEGINGTIEGEIKNTKDYIQEMEKSILFKGISYKKSIGTGNAFPKLKVRVRPEIVTAGLPEINPQQTTGKHITSEKLHEWLVEKKEFYIVDMRNDYEYASGFFEGFIPSGLRNFYDIKDIVPKIKHLKNKTIVTVCTGGVRCEKASGFLVTSGFTNVYQLKDGIQSYMEKYPGEHFKGKLYVFDNRLTVSFGNTQVAGNCMHCKVASDLYVNCEYDICHLHYICCVTCRDKYTGFAFCKKECRENYKNIQLPRMLKKQKLTESQVSHPVNPVF